MRLGGADDNARALAATGAVNATWEVSCTTPDGDGDGDGDGASDVTDNCPEIANPGQENSDGDGKGGACDADDDDDGAADGSDSCVAVASADQRDADGDGKGAACDTQELPRLAAPHPPVVARQVRYPHSARQSERDGRPRATRCCRACPAPSFDCSRTRRSTPGRPRSVPFADAPEAHVILHERRNVGKVGPAP